ncbi:hypothetical protein EMCRGX_G007852 [Ephydatia muelleri]
MSKAHVGLKELQKERKRPLNKKEDVKRCKLPQWKQGDMRRNSDGGDAASSDSTRRRQEPQWKQADMWRSSDYGDAALVIGKDKNLSGSKLICGAVQVVAMLLQVIAPGEDKNPCRV